MLAIARRPFSTRMTCLSKMDPTSVGRTCSVLTSCSAQIQTPLGFFHCHFISVLFKQKNVVRHDDNNKVSFLC